MTSNKMFVILSLILGLTISACYWADSFKYSKAFENGYEQKIETGALGSTQVIWVKRDSLK